jgi:hypothetical protein
MFVCCHRSLRRADHPSRGVLPTVVGRCVWSRNLKEKTLARVGPWCHTKKSVFLLAVIWKIRTRLCADESALFIWRHIQTLRSHRLIQWVTLAKSFYPEDTEYSQLYWCTGFVDLHGLSFIKRMCLVKQCWSTAHALLPKNGLYPYYYLKCTLNFRTLWTSLLCALKWIICTCVSADQQQMCEFDNPCAVKIGYDVIEEPNKLCRYNRVSL